MARREKVVELIWLANELGETSQGLTVTQIMQMTGMSRRSVERSLQTLQDLFSLEEVWDEDRHKRWRIRGGLGTRALTAPTSDELVELRHAAETLRADGATSRAERLTTLARKLTQAMRERDKHRIGSDVDALLEAETLARRPAPRAMIDPDVLDALRRALTAMKQVEIVYARPGREPTSRTLIPYGLLLGTHSYLIGVMPPYDAPYQYRLDRIRSVTVLDEAGPPPDDFDLTAYADRSFGTFQEDAYDIVLYFSPSAADDAEAFQFHPTQEIEREDDGSLTVRFTCGGLLQIAHHLFTWGDTVRIVAPDELRDTMQTALTRAHGAIAPDKESLQRP